MNANTPTNSAASGAQPDSLNTDELEAAAAIPKAVTRLRRRSASARRFAWVIFAAITLFAVCITVLLMPNKVTKTPDGYNYDYSYTYDYGFDYGSDTYSHQTPPKSGAKDKSVKQQWKETSEELKKLGDEVARLKAEVSDSASAQTESLRIIEDKVKRLNDIQIESSNMHYLDASLINSRFWEPMAMRLLAGAVLLVVLKTLVSIYRYQTRLCAFYNAAADVLDLAPLGTQLSIESLTSLLNPSSIDFTETSDSVMAHAVELAKKASTSLS